MEYLLSSKPRAALIGAGAIAPFHVAALRAVGFVVDHIAASPKSKRAAAFATDYNIARCWSNPVELIESGTWDAIVIAASTEVLPLLLSHVVKVGRPCLIEKPVAFDGAEILKFAKYEELVRVAYNRRFYSASAVAKSFADSKSCIFRLELPDTAQTADDDFVGLRAVRENSVHGLDLLRYVVGPYRIEKRLDVAHPRARIATVISDGGHVGSIVLNWNCPANFSLVLDSAPQRFEMRPFEMGSLYEGMEVLEPSAAVPVRRYVPKLIEQVSSFPDADGFKPGFIGQAQSLMQCVKKGFWDERSATLADAAAVADIAKSLTSQ